MFLTFAHFKHRRQVGKINTNLSVKSHDYDRKEQGKKKLSQNNLKELFF